MTRLSKDQASYLREITRQRAKHDRQMARVESLREQLNEMLRVGRNMGISTHRLAEASLLSQPRVQQLTTPTPQT